MECVGSCNSDKGEEGEDEDNMSWTYAGASDFEDSEEEEEATEEG